MCVFVGLYFLSMCFTSKQKRRHGNSLTNKDPLTLQFVVGFFFSFLPDFNLLTNWGAVVFGSWKIQLQPVINLLLMEANSVYGLF